MILLLKLTYRDFSSKAESLSPNFDLQNDLFRMQKKTIDSLNKHLKPQKEFGQILLKNYNRHVPSGEAKISLCQVSSLRYVQGCIVHLTVEILLSIFIFI